MSPSELRAHKKLAKRLPEIPTFKLLKRSQNKLPKPFKCLGGPRIRATSLLEVSGKHVVFFYWRSGELLSDRAFYGYLLSKSNQGELFPLFEFHWHPSHKGLHCKIPCKTVLDYTGRLLPQAPELNIKTPSELDPQIEADRLKLVTIFCNACGVELPDQDPLSGQLW